MYYNAVGDLVGGRPSIGVTATPIDLTDKAYLVRVHRPWGPVLEDWESEADAIYDRLPDHSLNLDRPPRHDGSNVVRGEN